MLLRTAGSLPLRFCSDAPTRRIQVPRRRPRGRRARADLGPRVRDGRDLPRASAVLMRILVLGGTKFLGRATMDAALARGHDVTLFNRGQTNPDLYPGVEKIRGDRTEGLSALDGRDWDAVLDMATFLPRVVRLSVDALRGHVGRYVYISSVSAYATHSTPEEQVEGAPVEELDDPGAEDLEHYGALKAVCESIVEDAYGEQALIVRPGLIVGPHDPTDRFTYWPRRIEAGGHLLPPGETEHPAQ